MAAEGKDNFKFVKIWWNDTNERPSLQIWLNFFFEQRTYTTNMRNEIQIEIEAANGAPLKPRLVQ